MRLPSFTDFFPSPPATEQPDWEQKRQRLFYVVEKAAADADIPLESLVVYGDAAEEILSLSEEKECDVIVIGSSGKGRMKRTLLGSVSTKVALHARCSVYIVR
jgi:nucleotide-binding universal stress UspA family protein